MPTRGRYTTILIDRTDISGHSNNLELQIQNGVIDVTPFQSAGKQFLVEPPQANMRHNGYMTNLGTNLATETALQQRLGTGTNYVAALLGTDVTACPAYVIHAAIGSEMNIQAPANNVITIQGNWIAGSAVGAGIKRGVRLFGGTLASTGAQTHVDLGAAGTDGFAYLFVTGTSGTPSSATVTVQSADNTGFSSATTHGTFTFSAADAYAMTITGTIDRYARINLTSLGGATNLTITAVIVSLGVTQAVA